jgi:hypothetical protein
MAHLHGDPCEHCAAERKLVVWPDGSYLVEADQPRLSWASVLLEATCLAIVVWVFLVLVLR